MSARALEADAQLAVAQAAKVLIEGLTSFASYKGGKWQASGKDESMGMLHVAVIRWQMARAAVEQEEADDAMPQEYHDNRQFFRDALGV